MNNQEIIQNLENIQVLIAQKNTSQPMAMMNAVMVETMGISMHNAVNTQHHAQQTNNAATTSACARILATVGPPPPKKPASSGEGEK